MVLLFSNSLKKAKIFIRSIRISKNDPSLIQKHRSGLEKEEILAKDYDPFYIKTSRGYVRRKLKRLRKRSDKYFVRRPRWLYRIKKRSSSYYHTFSFLSRRARRYKASALMAGREIRIRRRIYLKKGKKVVVWQHWFLKRFKRFAPWKKRAYSRYKNINRYMGVWIRKRPNMVQFKKGIRQHRYFRFSKKFRRIFKRRVHARLSRRFRLRGSKRSFRFATRLKRRRRLSFRQRRVTVRAYSLRKLYRVFSLRRRSTYKAKSTLRLLKFRIRAQNTALRARVHAGLRFRQFKRLTRKVFKLRNVQDKNQIVNKRNTLLMFKHLLVYKPELRFGAKFKFKKLLKKLLTTRKLKRAIKAKKLRSIRKLRLRGKLKGKVRFFSYKKKIINNRNVWRVSKPKRTKAQLRVLKLKLRNRKKLSRVASVRHFRHSLSAKIRRTKLHRRRLAYVSLVKAIKKKNVKTYLHGKKQFFYNRISPFSWALGGLTGTYARLRFSRAFKRYTYLTKHFLKAYKAYRTIRISKVDGLKKLRITRRQKKLKEIRLRLRLLQRKRKDQDLDEKKSYRILRSIRSLRKYSRLITLRRRVLRTTIVNELASLLGHAVSFYSKRKKKGLISFESLKNVLRKKKVKKFLRKRFKYLLKSYEGEVFIKRIAILRSLGFQDLVSESFTVEELIAKSRILYASRRVKTAKLKAKRKLPYSIRSLLYSSKRALVKKNLLLSKKRDKWRKSVIRDQYYADTKIFEDQYANWFRNRNKNNRIKLKRYSKRIRRIVTLKRPALKSRVARLIKRSLIIHLVKRSKEKFLLLRKRIAERRREKRNILLKSKRSGLELRRKLGSKRLRRVQKLGRRFKKDLTRRQIRNRSRYVKYDKRRRVHLLQKKVQGVIKKIRLRRNFLKDELNFLKSEYFFQRPKVRVRVPFLRHKFVPELSQFHKKRLFFYSQYTKFLKQGFVLKRGFQYNNLRKFYESENITLSRIRRNSLGKRIHAYKRLTLVKRRKVHRYKLWWGIKQRRYMHRRRFLSSKPKRRIKRFIPHLPAVHITQTNSNYFVYIIVNKQVVFVKSTGHCGFEGSKRKAPYAVEKLGLDVGNWLLSKNMRYVTLRPHFPKLFYVARLALKGMLKPYRLKPSKRIYHLRKHMYIYPTKPQKHRVEVVLIRRLLSKAHNGLRLPTRRRL